MVDFKNMKHGETFFINSCSFVDALDMWVETYTHVVFLGFEEGSNESVIRIVQPMEENFVMTVDVARIADEACLDIIPFEPFELCPVCGGTVLSAGVCVNFDDCDKAQADDAAKEKEDRRKQYEALAKEFGG